MRPKIFGFPVYVHKFFWFLCLVVAFSRFITGKMEHYVLLPVLFIVIFLTMLWHELGHAFKRRKFGAESAIVLGDVKSIGGAVTGYCAGESKFTKKQSISVSLAGPIFNLIIVALVFPLKYTPLLDYPYVEPIWEMLWLANLGWAIFNVAPVLPLDGGHIFRVLMTNSKPVLVPLIGLILSIMIAVLGAITQKYFASIIFLLFFFQNWHILWKKKYHGY